MEVIAMKKKKLAGIALLVSLALVCSTVDGGDTSGLRAAASNKATEEKKQQVIGGPMTYNVYRQFGETTLELVNSSCTDLSYTIVDGGSIAGLSDSGNQLVFSGDGTVLLEAVAEETSNYYEASAYIAVSANKYQFGSGIDNEVYNYDGFEHPFNAAVNGAKECTPLYLDTNSGYPEWTADAPVSAGTYIVRLDLVTSSGAETAEFVTIQIKKRKVQVTNLKVTTKEWDGTTDAVLTGNLTGVIEDDDVRLELPDASFLNSNAGKNKKVTTDGGKVSLSGSDADQYKLEGCSLNNLKGTIKPKKVTIKADDKTSTEGSAVLPLTYSTEGIDEINLKSVELSCKVTKKSPAGTYVIKIKSVKGNPNYSFKKVSGTYTVLSDGYGSGSTGSSGSIYEKPDTGGPLTTTPPTALPMEPSVPLPTDSPSSAPAYVFKLTPESLGQVLVFDGMSELANSTDKKFVINYWLTKDAVVKTTDHTVKISANNKTWHNRLQFGSGAKKAGIKGGRGFCLSKNNLVFYAKHKNTVCKVEVRRFICDKEIPLITLDGIGMHTKRSAVGPGISQNGSFTFSVDATFGLSGKKMLSYKYVSDSSVIDVDSSWNEVKQNQIIIDRDFSGYLAIKAADRIGNTFVVYTDTVTIDAAAPKVTGIENGAEYDGGVSYTVSDLSGVAYVTLDGHEATESGEVYGGGTSYNDCGRCLWKYQGYYF